MGLECKKGAEFKLPSLSEGEKELFYFLIEISTWPFILICFIENLETFMEP